jgi:hypothetical protein
LETTRKRRTSLVRLRAAGSMRECRWGVPTRQKTNAN